MQAFFEGKSAPSSFYFDVPSFSFAHEYPFQNPLTNCSYAFYEQFFPILFPSVQTNPDISSFKNWICANRKVEFPKKRRKICYFGVFAHCQGEKSSHEKSWEVRENSKFLPKIRKITNLFIFSKEVRKFMQPKT